MANTGSNNEGTASEFPAMTRLVNTSAAKLAACGDAVRKLSAAIQPSCETPGTGEAAYKHLLHSKMQELKRLKVFCDITAARLMDLDLRIRSDLSQEESLAELLAISRSTTDQLQNHKRDVRRILSLLQEDAGCCT